MRKAIIQFLLADLLVIFLSFDAHAGLGDLLYLSFYLNEQQLEVVKIIKAGRPVLVLLEPRSCKDSFCRQAVKELRFISESLRIGLGNVQFARFAVPDNNKVRLYLQKMLGIFQLPSAVFFVGGKRTAFFGPDVLHPKRVYEGLTSRKEE